jgi:spore coat protein CotF
MNNNKISNPKTEVPTGKMLNDKDYMNCLLSTLKEIVKNYSTALTEASNEELYNGYKSMFDNYIAMQRDVYELMFRYGWYSLEKAEVQKIDSKIQILNQELSNLN